MTCSPEIEANIQECLQAYSEMSLDLGIFLDGVTAYFQRHPQLTKGSMPVIHSVKRRLKDEEHLAEKIRRKYVQDGSLRFPPSELGKYVTDLAGVRVLHLHQDQFPHINTAIRARVASGDWIFDEPPKAYTWDPEFKKFFEGVGMECHLKDSFYTSVHYVIRARINSPFACEIQVRTLFEEVWGEVDHSLKYPDLTPNKTCVEQLSVLAKLVGAGTRLVDSIYRTSKEP